MKRTLSLLIAGTLAGCARQTPQQPASATAAPALRAMGQDISVEDAHSDEAIGQQIRNQFQATAAADTAAVTIEVNNGIVVLRGSAPSQAASWRAQALATAVNGVKSVINQLVITSRPSTPPS
jgi:osmotically-inducible protein OsmY